MLAVGLLDFDCSTCTAAQKKARGCTADAPVPHEIGGMTLPRCPRRPLLDDPAYFSQLFWQHQQFKKGMLPDEGSLLSQPGKLMDLFFEIDRSNVMVEQEVARQRKAAEARQSRKVRRRGK